MTVIGYANEPSANVLLWATKRAALINGDDVYEIALGPVADSRSTALEITYTKVV